MNETINTYKSKSSSISGKVRILGLLEGFHSGIFYKNSAGSSLAALYFLLWQAQTSRYDLRWLVSITGGRSHHSTWPRSLDNWLCVLQWRNGSWIHQSVDHFQYTNRHKQPVGPSVVNHTPRGYAVASVITLFQNTEKSIFCSFSWFEAIVRLSDAMREPSRLIWPNDSSGIYTITPVVNETNYYIISTKWR